MPAPTPTAAPATNATLTPAAALRSRRRVPPRPVGGTHHRPPCRGSSTGTPTWPTRQRIASNIRPKAHQPGTGAVREGSALLQGLATCGTCGRKLAVSYDGPAKSTPGYSAPGPATGRRPRNPAPARRRFRPSTPPSPACSWPRWRQRRCRPACMPPQQLEDGHDAALDQCRRQVEQARYAATRAERRYRPVDPENRLVARGLETEWETALDELADAETELARREPARPAALTAAERAAILALGDDLEPGMGRAGHHRQGPQAAAAHPAGGSHRHRPPRRHRGRADLLLRWKGGAISELAVPLRRQPPKFRTDEDTVEPDPPAGRPLPRRQDRRDPQPAAPRAPPEDCPTPPVESSRCATTDIPCHQPAATPRKENCSPWPKPPGNWAWSPPPCTAG